MDLRSYIAEVIDHPEPGISFKDITPLLANPQAFEEAVDWYADELASVDAEAVLAVDARGFLFAAPAAYKLGLPLLIARKSGKLPPPVTAAQYEREYGEAPVFEVRADTGSRADVKGKRIAIVDDLLATGGTCRATADLAARIGGVVVAYVVLIELAFLNGRAVLAEHAPDCQIISRIAY